MAWTDGKSKKEIAKVIAQRNATRAANKKKKERAEKRKAKLPGFNKESSIKVNTLDQKERQTKDITVNIHNTTGTVTFEGAQEYFVNVKLKGMDTHKLYTYKTDIPGIVPGDLVVVNAAGTFTLAEVREVHTLRRPGVYVGILKTIVQKVDLADYMQREQARARKAELANSLQRMKKRIDEESEFEVYAERDPAFKALLDEYKALGA